MDDRMLVNALIECDDAVTCKQCKYLEMCDGPVWLSHIAARRLAQLLGMEVQCNDDGSDDKEYE